MVALSLTVIVILGTSVARSFGPLALRILFWIVIGVACSAFFEFGIDAILVLVLLLVAGNWFSVAMSIDATYKDMGRVPMQEICVYRVRDGRIVSEQFFYDA